MGAEIWTPGPMASIKLKRQNSSYANGVQAPSFSLEPQDSLNVPKSKDKTICCGGKCAPVLPACQ